MTGSEEHRYYLRQTFKPGFRLHMFSKTEAVTLRKRGAWLDALMRGQIKPVTPEQDHFVQVCRGKVTPTTELEKLWWKYRMERLYVRAASADKLFATSDFVSYKKVRAQFEALARMGHPKAIAWMKKEGPWVDLPPAAQSQYAAKSIFNCLYPLSKMGSGSFGSKYDVGQEPR